MRQNGYLGVADNVQDHPHPAGAPAMEWQKRFFGGCDPGRIVHVHVREIGSAAVSYTHLDVYKRQGRCRSARRASTPRTASSRESKVASAVRAGSGAGTNRTHAEVCLLYTSRCV